MLAKSKWIDPIAKALAQWNANALQGSAIATTAPSLDNVHQWNSALQWAPIPPEQLLNPSRAFQLKDEFITSLTALAGVIGELCWSTTVSGSGTAQSSTNISDGNHPGIIQLTAGGFGGASGIILNNTSSVVNLGGGALYNEWLINIPTLATTTNDYTIRIGIGDTQNADFVNGVYFQYNRGTSVNWQIKTASASTRTTTTSTVVTVTGWTKLSILVNAAGTSANFYINQILAGTISTNIPTVATNFSAHQVRVAGTVVGFYIDYFWLYQRFTTAR